MLSFSSLCALSFVAAVGAQGLLRGTEERSLYPATFGGFAYSGPTRNNPVNACFSFDRSSESFSQCDGKAAADAYCRERGYAKATDYKLAPLSNTGSSWVFAGNQVVEAGIKDDQQLLQNVVCDT